MGTQKHNGSLYFDQNKTKKNDRYVAWIDLLGTKSSMLTSHARTVNFVMRIHLACLATTRPNGLSIHPMNDGVFIVSESGQAVLDFVKKIMGSLSDLFCNEPKPELRFMARGAIAYGPVSIGSADLAAGSNLLAGHATYVDSIVLGMPLAQSYESEKRAPPFGIYVHESARVFGDKSTPRVFYRWLGANKTKSSAILAALKAHFAWMGAHKSECMVDGEWLKKIEELSCEYFG